MKKLILAIVLSQALYAEYLYNEDISTDTGESIKAHQHSKHFDGQCVEMREGIVESLENKDYNKLYKQDKQETLDSIKKARQSLTLKTDKKSSWKYYDMCELGCDFFGAANGFHRLYVFERENLKSVYDKIYNLKNFMSKKEFEESGVESLAKILPQRDFQEVIQTPEGYDGRRCYMYDKHNTLWIRQAANPGGCNFTFLENPNNTEVLIDCIWGFDFD